MSPDATVMAVGSPRATSLAKEGPLSAPMRGLKPDTELSTPPITAVMVSSVSPSMPLRPSTMEMAVPHAPAPITAIRLTPLPSSSSPEGEAGLGAGQEPRDVSGMLDHNQQADDDRRRQDGDHVPVGPHVHHKDRGR